MSTEFEWNLSQENIIRRTGGRSVEQLSVVLKCNNTTSFINWRIAMRRHFEESLKICPVTGKMQLYKKYIRWIEDYYPALGAPARLGEVLYHCVSDVCHMESISSNPDYLAIWLKLIPFCDHQSELFPLLLNHGIGQHYADFYIAWSNHVVKLSHSLNSSDSSTKTIASILARGLRENAKPFCLMEDYVERFIWTVEKSNNHPSEKQESEPSKKAPGVAPVEARKTLASLRLIESVNTGVDEPNQWSVPSVRVGSALSENQRGLTILPPKVRCIPSRHDTGLRIFRDPPSSSSSAGDVIPLLPSAECSTPPLLMYADPSTNIENIKPAEIKLIHQSVKMGSSTSSSVGTESLASLEIYRDPSPQLDSARPTYLSSTLTSSGKNSRSHGLQVLDASYSKAVKDLCPFITFDNIKAILLGQDVHDLTTLSVLNTSEPTSSEEFVCDLELLSVDGEEKCFEMIKAEHHLKSSNPSKSDSNSPPLIFSPNLDDDISRQIILEITDIVTSFRDYVGLHKTEPSALNSQSSINETNTEAELNARKLALEKLQSIISGRDSIA